MIIYWAFLVVILRITYIYTYVICIQTCNMHVHIICVSVSFDCFVQTNILVRGHPKMSTFSQVYKPYARGVGGNTRCTLLIYNKC